jgi:hypothetical protein
MHILQPRSQIDYMLRETRSQLVSFSQLADTKANILLSVSSVIATLSITKFTDPHWALPVAVLVVFLLGAIFFSLLAVIPSMNLFQAKKVSTSDPQFNTLFFGDYTRVSYPDYLEHMETVMNDPDRVYEALVREIYSAGSYLQKTKYNYIKYGYILFFVGALGSALIFLIQNH